jgi:predicted MFS family arabinose efflux permease
VVVGALLLVAFVLIERRVEFPLLPLRIVFDRVRGAAYLSLGISGTGMFAVFLFLTYYLANTLGYTPLETGFAFLPMIGSVMFGAVFSGAVLLPRTGPRPLVPIGCVLAAIGMALLTGIGTYSTYAGSVLPALLVTGIGFGLIFGPVQNAATSGVRSHDAGVASALATTAQQIGGSIGTAVFSSLATTAIGQYLSVHPGATAAATLAGYHLVFWIAAAVFLGSALLAALLFRGGPLPISSEVLVAA